MSSFYESIVASKSGPKLRTVMLKAKEARAIVTIGNQKRMLFHSPFSHASATKFPWPLSLFEIHDVALAYLDSISDEFVGETKRFKKNQIEQAINEFLSDCPPDSKIQLSGEF